MISLLTWLQGLLADPETRAAFFTDPDGFTGSAGFDHLSSADFHDALILVSDTEPVSYHDRFTDPPTQHQPTDLDVSAVQSPGDYLKDYLAASYPDEADDPGSFGHDRDNDPLAHHHWAGLEHGTDHAVGGFTGADGVDPEFGAGSSVESHPDAEPAFASGGEDLSVHSSEVTGPSAPEHFPDDDPLAANTHESMFGPELRTDLDHDDHSEHEVHHPPL